MTFGIDSSHSSIAFKVRHFFTQVPGTFGDYTGTIVYDPANPEASSVSITVQSASIDTRNEQLDNHLRSADFFDAAQYPTLSFVSTAVKSVSDDELAVTGDFSLRGVTQRMTVNVRFLGMMKAEQTIAGFATELTIDRKDFGIGWNRALDQGGTILGDEVTIVIDLEVVEEAAAKDEADG